MNDFAVATAPRTVRFERLLPGSIETVWAFLTESDKRSQWLASGPMELKPGGAVHLRWTHADLSAHKAETPERFKKYDCGSEMHTRVLRCEPPRLLSIAWGAEPASEVTFELTPKDGKVLLVLTHARLPTREEMLQISGGWHAHLDVLAERLAGREPPFFWSLFEKMEGQYENRLPD